MARGYRGLLTVHFSDSKVGEYSRLKNALVYSGWRWVDTGAFEIETQNLAQIWRGIELAARQSADVGFLSNLSFHIQPSGDDGGLRPRPKLSRWDAINRILEKPLPKP